MQFTVHGAEAEECIRVPDPPQAHDSLRADAGERLDFQRRPQGFIIYCRQHTALSLSRYQAMSFSKPFTCF